MIIQILTDAIYWLFGPTFSIAKAMFADSIIVSISLRLVQGKWWWDLYWLNKPKPGHWELKFNDDGWQMSGSGHNPLVTLRKIYDDAMNREQKSIADEIRDITKQRVRQHVRTNLVAKIDAKLGTAPLSDSSLDKLIDEIIKSELKDNDGSDKPKSTKN